MRKSNRNLLFATLAISGLAVGGAACQKGGGDVNAQNINVTVKIPKALVSSAAGIGVVYVGIYAGVDNTKGYPSPITAPAASSAGDDAFPYGGSSIGDFENRDARYVCQLVTNQNVVDGGDHWELQTAVLQFPWIKGEVVWAFTDRYDANLFLNGNVLDAPFSTAFPTCDPANGYFDNYGFPIQITAITETNEDSASVPGPYWKVQFAPTTLNNPAVEGGGSIFGAADPLQVLDANGQFYQAVKNATNDTLLDSSAYTIVVSTPIGTTLVPKATGATPTRLEKYNAQPAPYGTQHQDILNFPSNYIESGDLVVATPAVLNTPSDVTITLDTVVP